MTLRSRSPSTTRGGPRRSNSSGKSSVTLWPHGWSGCPSTLEALRSRVLRPNRSSTSWPQLQSLEASRAAIAAAGSVGYAYFPYRTEVMHWFCKPSPSVRTHHLHLVPIGSRLWNERLAFRDALRADEDLRTEYRNLKLALAARYRHDREGYTDAKAPFIHRVLERLARGGAAGAHGSMPPARG